MAFPEPVPVLTGEQAEEFARRLRDFKLTDEQKAFYREAMQIHRRHKDDGKKYIR